MQFEQFLLAPLVENFGDGFSISPDAVRQFFVSAGDFDGFGGEKTFVLFVRLGRIRHLHQQRGEARRHTFQGEVGQAFFGFVEPPSQRFHDARRDADIAQQRPFDILAAHDAKHTGRRRFRETAAKRLPQQRHFAEKGAGLDLGDVELLAFIRKLIEAHTAFLDQKHNFAQLLRGIKNRSRRDLFHGRHFVHRLEFGGRQILKNFDLMKISQTVRDILK